MAQHVGKVFMDYDGRLMMCIRYNPPSHNYGTSGYGAYEEQYRIDIPAWYDMVYIQSLLQTKIYDIIDLTQIEHASLTLDQVFQLMQDRQREEQLEKRKQVVRDEISSWDQKIAEDRRKIKKMQDDLVEKEDKRKELIDRLKSIQ
jgi:hypothetical protein